MNSSDRAKEWERYYNLLQTDEAKFALFARLKHGDKVEREVLRRLVERWLAE